MCASRLGGAFAGRVGGQGAVGGVFLVEGQPLGLSIDRGGGGQHEILAAVPLGGVEQVERAIHVDGEVQTRLSHALAHPGHGRQMRHAPDIVRGEERVYGRRVADIAFDQGEGGIGRKLGGVGPLDGRIVVVVEVVYGDDALATRQQGPRQMTADETGSAGDQNAHSVSFPAETAYRTVAPCT